MCHHPPITACIAENDHYKYHMDTNTQMGISWSGTLKATPIGFQHVYLKAFNEHYLIGRPATTVNNLLFGTMYIEHVGNMSVKNCKTGMECPIDFKAAGWGNAGKHEIHGTVIEKEGSKKVLGTLTGKWSEKLEYKVEEKMKKKETLWEANPLPPRHDWQYYFTEFAMNLNHMPEAMKQHLPICDSRLRPDLRALEENNLEVAEDEKKRLEEKQRAARKERADKLKPEFEPKYFKKVEDPDSKEEFYAYGPQHGCRDYWADRKVRDFAHMENIY